MKEASVRAKLQPIIEALGKIPTEKTEYVLTFSLDALKLKYFFNKEFPFLSDLADLLMKELVKAGRRWLIRKGLDAIEIQFVGRKVFVLIKATDVVLKRVLEEIPEIERCDYNATVRIPEPKE